MLSILTTAQTSILEPFTQVTLLASQMKITKPAWVSHSRQHETKTLPIYCLHVHPDCSRIATGGLDAKVRIWSTLPILDEGVAAKEENPKLLCTLGTHNGQSHLGTVFKAAPLFFPARSGSLTLSRLRIT